MIPLVVDASVAVKWFLHESDHERNSDEALRWLRASCSGEVHFLQPPHFRAEVAAVLARLKPDESVADIADFLEMEFSVFDDVTIYQAARALSVQLGHHLFDTMYHAIALKNSGARLITADERYYRKARHLGAIQRLEPGH